MSKLIEAAKLAREALKEINKLSIGEHAICLPAEIDTAMDALDQAIAEAEQQEPVAWTLLLTGKYNGIVGKAGNTFAGHPEYYRRVDVFTSAPKREWQGLTDDEIAEMHNEIKVRLMGTYRTEDIYRAIEAKLKEKNT